MTIPETHTAPEAGDEDLGDLLLEVLPPDGGTMSNQAAREALSRAAECPISKDEYEKIKERAFALGLVVKGSGRGGSIALSSTEFNTKTSDGQEAMKNCGESEIHPTVGKERNARSRSLYYGDNISTLKAIPTESVDLIYLDPPYNSKRIYNCSFGGNAQAKAFDDNWQWDHDQDKWMDEIKNSSKELWGYLDALLKIFRRRDGLPAYLTAMSVRLLELHRVLKNTGSCYLHVDRTAAHYLKIAMDLIFGGENFRNEIIWHYQSGGRQKQSFSNKHDTIFFYTKSKNWYFDASAVGIKRGEQKRNNMKRGYDEDGRGYWSIKSAGKIYKYYDDETITPADVWTDISHLQQKDPERMGYPTQKPVALLKRIIQASSKDGDIVLDPYMGSGTTIEVAETLGRNWIGLDITHHAVACTTSRLIERCGLSEKDFEVIGVPQDIEAAHHLWEIDRRQFEAWAVLGVHAIPHQTTKDGRIIGVRPFADIRDNKVVESNAVYVVCEEKQCTIEDIRKLNIDLKEQRGEIGFLISIEECSREVLLEIEKEGFISQNNGRSHHPRVQHISARDIIDNPASARRFFCVERRKNYGKAQSSEQKDLFDVV